ncbi:MAG: valine--tRNA ligase [Bacteroidota bacterium]
MFNEKTQEIENKWYAYWQKHGFFQSKPNKAKTPCVVGMPPPNITGILHMGHVLNLTIQDILVRKARMEGKETCWVPGIDHASIATEAKVVAKLKKEGMTKTQVGREAFLKAVWDWKEVHGDIIVKQMKKLGISCDWHRMKFTMEPTMSAAVIDAFVYLYNKGYIYRAKRMINWDPAGKTALSNEEIIYKTETGKLYYIHYRVEGEAKPVSVVTTRPETLLGDTALCVHPDDKRYQHLHGKAAYVPLIKRAIPIITDPYVDPTFGTGCLKVTPAHDPNDYKLGQKHDLPTIDIFTDTGQLNKNAILYIGEDRMVARKKIVADLKAAGQLEKVGDHVHQVGFSERTGTIVEPRLSTQWFVKMKALAAPAIQSVEDKTIHFYPHKFVNMYMTWMRNIQDWCISRQLWWGQRIPVYYLADKRFVVACNEEEAVKKAQQLTGNPQLTAADLAQDPDVLDTWFSSWLWPISIFDGTHQPNNADFLYYYPTHYLVTAPEIIFFWVARMIMAGYEFTGKAPFRHVYFTGIVRDAQKRKMSKSLGNSPDPLLLIEKYGVDGVRAGMLFCAPAGNDLLFDEQLCQQGAQFSHKIKHALRLVSSWTSVDKAPKTFQLTAVAWFTARLRQAVAVCVQHFKAFKLSEALMVLYKLFWDDFCATYLEMVKPKGEKILPMDTYQATRHFFVELMQLLHPFMPFVTEEVWQSLATRKEGDSIMLASYPVADDFDEVILAQAMQVKALIAHIRQAKSNSKLLKEPLDLYVKGAIPRWCQLFLPYIKKCTGVGAIKSATDVPAQQKVFLVDHITFWLPQLPPSEPLADQSVLREKLAYQEKFLAQIEQKLQNNTFLVNAPKKIIALERKKRADTQKRIETLLGLLTPK